MKPSRHRIDIFSVSAIDLFASALGAFLIVSFVLLPYFPNTGEAPPTAAALHATPGLPPAPPGVLPQAPRLRSIDLVIALDTTASMAREVARLREEIASLTELLARLVDDAAVGIIDFKDRCDSRTALRSAPLAPVDPASAARLAAFARAMRASDSACDRTLEEDFAEALRAAVGSDWRTGVEQRSIVMISDSPAHADRRAQAIADAARFARRPDAVHTVSAIFVDSDRSTRAQRANTESFMVRITQAGHGQLVRADRGSALSMMILGAIIRD